MNKLVLTLLLLAAPVIQAQDLVIRRGTTGGSSTDTNAIANSNGFGTNTTFYGTTTVDNLNVRTNLNAAQGTFTNGLNVGSLVITLGGTNYGLSQNSNGTYLNLVVTNSFTQGNTLLTITGTSNIVFNCALYNYAKVVLTAPGFVVFSNIPGTNVGYSAMLDILQDSTGARTLHSAGETNFHYTNNTPAGTNLTALINTNANGQTTISFKNSSWTNGQVNAVITPL